MKIFYSIMIFAALVTTQSSAQTIANCTNPKGVTFYHNSKIVSKNKSGFQDDEINPGTFTFQKLSNGKYDLLSIDASKKINSVAQNGDELILIVKNNNYASFMLYSKNYGAEIYTLWIDTEGQSNFDLIQSVGGQSIVDKSTILTGKCSKIDFALINSN